MNSTAQNDPASPAMHLRTPVKHARTQHSQSESADTSLLTSLPSLSREDTAAASMLMSPPPEETLRTPRARSTPATSRSSVTPAPEPLERFGGHVISNTISSKRKRNVSSLTAPSSRHIIRSASVDTDGLEVIDNSQNLLDATPNPKPRKQSKRGVSFAPESPIRLPDHTSASALKPSHIRIAASASPTKKSLLQSPHLSNPQADYIPPSPSFSREHTSARRRSVTPIPPYEPPAERFTPPREVLCTPVNFTTPKISKSSKRKSVVKSNGKTKKLVLQIKKELPDDIDLNAPPPPPSPTDDPLLLLGSQRRTRSQLRQSHSVTHARDTPPLASSSPIRSEDLQQTRLLDLTLGAAGGMDLTSDDLTNTSGIEMPVFDFIGGGNWVDDQDSSDGEGASPFDQSGEFTGKFKVLTVPTKIDPPSSCTKSRMDAWGHPVSPFPSRNIGDEDEDMIETPVKQASEAQLQTSQDGRQEEDVFGRPEVPKAASPSPATVHRSPSPPASPSTAPSQGEVDIATAEAEGIAQPPLPELEEEQEVITRPESPAVSGPRESPHPTGPFDFDASFISPARSELEDPHTEEVGDKLIPIHEDLIERDEVHSVDERHVHFTGEGLETPSESIIEDVSQSFEEPDTLEVIAPLPEPRHSPPPTVPERNNDPIEVHRRPPLSRIPRLSVEAPLPDAIEVVSPSRSLSPEVNLPPREPSTDIEVSAAIPTDEEVEPNSGNARHSPSPLPRSPSPVISHPVRPAEAPRTPAPQIEMDNSDDEDEDEVTVFRELSQPPEVDSDEEQEKHDDLLARSFARVSLMSPNNLFQSIKLNHVLETPLNNGSEIRQAWRKEMGVGQWGYGLTPDRPVVVEDEDVDVSGDDDDELDEKVIKITSDDPRAAARAAAILRLHRYNCLDEYHRRKRRHSHSGVDSILSKSRRRTTAESGVSKTPSAHRRRTLGGVIGDKVYIPGSPVITLPELLHEAEVSVHLEGADLPRSPYTPIKFPARSPPVEFETPVRKSGSFLDPNDIPSLRRTPITLPTPGPRGWSRDDWKLLDGCYTDERLALGDKLGLGPEEMAPADEVDLESVVDRYVGLIGGEGVAEVLGDPWLRENLLKRARALQRKQRSGNVAPPTPARASSVSSNDTSYQGFMSSMSPDPTPSRDVSYLQLMNDAKAIEAGPPKPPPIISYLKNAPQPPPRRQSTLGKVKGFFFSYLRTTPKKKPVPPKTSAQPGFPIPPAEVFQKPRGHIATPASKPPPKSAHPKEVVQLQPAPNKSASASAGGKGPKRLVELHHVPPPQQVKSQSLGTLSGISRERRDSNASVKDLVQSFEDLQKRQSMELDKERVSLSRLEIRRTKSVKEWSRATSRTGGRAKPVWKP